MKKFLSKKPVMIVFIVAAAVFLAVEIGILVRPISYGLNYTYKETVGTVEMVSTIKVHSDSIARLSMEEGEDKIVMDMWIYRDGDKVITLEPKKLLEYSGMTDEQIEAMNKDCMTKDEYKKEVEELKTLKKENSKLYALKMLDAMEFGVFQAKMGDDIARCPQAIIFVSVHGALTFALVTFATLAVLCVLKKKKA